MKTPISRTLINTLIIFLLLQPLLITIAYEEEDDFESLEELFAIDDEEEKQQGGANSGKQSLGAEVLSRAQRIVLELNNDNVKKVIESNEQVLLLGYTPWCPRSAELMPKFAEAATTLRGMGSAVVLAKIDCERHEKVSKELGISGFPTLLLFTNGSSIRYSGGFSKEEIVIWARKKTGVPVIRLSSVDAAEEFLKSYQQFALGFFDKYEGYDYEEFLKAATTNNEIQFAETNDISVATRLFPGVEPEKKFLGLVKSEPERFEKFDDSFEEEKILQFVEFNKFPLINVLTEQNSAKVYASSIKVQVYVFAEADEFEHLRNTLQVLAKRFKRKIMFIYVDNAEENLAKPFLTLYGIESDEPVVTAFDNRIGAKYLLEAALTLKNLEEFCSGLLDGTVSPYYKSEPIPNKQGLVEKVVGKTFAASVLDSAENIFLEVFTPWCIDCEATSKQVEKLAKHFKGKDNIKFARIDASSNEHPKLQVTNYPAILFYPAGDKTEPIKLSKKSSLKDLVSFINKNLKSEPAVDAHKGQDKKDEL